ncbi:MAG TPA: ABC transporter ATP-binding protein [Terriglobales bacterium]|nr:ABC transporter ATP-binding protein [Terriglobales bacterium]
MSALLEVQNLTVEFPGSPAENRNGATHTAVRSVSLTIQLGEVVGLVGESGSGKSVTSLAIMRLLVPQARVSGAIVFGEGEARRDILNMPEAEVRAIRGSRIAMIFQEPMTALNPVMRVGDQIAEAMQAHQHVSKREAWERAVEAIQGVAIPEAAKRARDYPHQLSGGMRQRIMIAMALVNRPELLIADEPTTALDVTIQAQILELLADLRAKYRLAMLFISHDLAVVSQVADRVAVMYAGCVVEMASKCDIFRAPAHPYTRGLLQAIPTLHTRRDQPLRTIEGTVPGLGTVSPGCAFAPRCDWREAECETATPPLVEVGEGHWARCPVISRQSSVFSRQP